MLGHFAAYFGQFFPYFISFLSRTFKRRCLAESQFMHILYFMLRLIIVIRNRVWFYMLFYVQLQTLNDSMSFYCFSHYFNDISMVTVFKQ